MDRLQTHFNGALYLVKDLFYSDQYLGSGRSQKEAFEDMEKTIKKYGLKTLPHRVEKYGTE